MSEQTPAFKEWAIIAEALGSGRQALTLRKGGIHERAGGFTPIYPRFWLFPTGFHQHTDNVHDSLTDVPENMDSERIQLRYIAEVLDTYRIDSIAALKRLSPWHYWKWETVKERYYFGKWQGVYALVLDVQVVKMPVTLELKKTYGGCKSWLELPITWPSENDLRHAMHPDQLAKIRADIKAEIAD